MVAVLVTGMSGVGKSTALAGLAARGHEVVDTDEPGWIEVVDGEPLWLEARILALLDRPRPVALFVAGTVVNQGRFPFDVVVLLTAPLDVLLDRLLTRTTNPFGRTAEERAAVIRDHREVEPVLRARADVVVDTTAPRSAVLDALEACAAP